MSTRIEDYNNITRGTPRRRKAMSAGDNEATFEKVFREKVVPISFNVGLAAKVHAINKTFLFPDVVSQLDSNIPVQRNKALRKLTDWLSQSDALSSGKYDTADLVGTLTRLFQKLRRYGIKHEFGEETKVLGLLELLSTQKKNATLMISKNLFIKELYNILYNVQAEHQDQAARILYNLTNKNPEMVPLFVKKNKPFGQLVKIFKRPVGTLYYPKNLFLHTANLLEVYPVSGVKNGFFEVFLNRIHHKLPGYHLENMRCFTALLKSRKGFDLFKHSGVMNILLKLITNRPTADFNLEYVLKCFNEGLNNEEMQKECVPYLKLPSDVAEIAKKSKDKVIQKVCAEIIQKMVEVKHFDSVINAKCMKGLRKMNPEKEDVEYNEVEMGRLLKFLEIASASRKSASVMASKDIFVSQLYKILTLSRSKHKVKAAHILVNLTSGSGDNVRDFAEKNSSFEKVALIFKNRGLRSLPGEFWTHVSHLIQASPQLGLKHGFFEICEMFIKSEKPGFEKGPSRCLACLLQSNKAFELYEVSDVLGVFLKFLHENKDESCELSHILTCLNESLQSESLLKQLLQFPELPCDIIQIIKVSKNPDIQLKAMEVIKKLYLNDPFDIIIHSKCLAPLKKIKFEEEFADYERQQFVNFLMARHNLYKSKSH